MSKDHIHNDGLIPSLDPFNYEGEEQQAEDNFLHVRQSETNRQLQRINTKRMAIEELDYSDFADLMEQSDEPIYSKMTPAERKALRGRGLTLGQLQWILSTDTSGILELDGAKVERALDIALSFIDPQEYFLDFNAARQIVAFIPISEYAVLTNKTNKTRAKKELKDQLETLAEVKYKEPKLDGFLRLIDSYYFVEKKVYGEAGYEVVFNPMYIALLAKNGFNADIPKALMGIDIRYYGLAYILGKELCSHSNRNLGKPNETRMKVITLLEYAKGYLPSEEEVRATSSRYTELIVAPFEKNLDILKAEGVLLDWDYCHKNGEPLTDEEQALRLDTDQDGNFISKPMDYRIFKDLQLTWELKEEYERDKRLKTREASRKRKATAKKNAEKRREKKRAIKDKAYAEEMGRQQAKEDAAKARAQVHYDEEPLHFD